MVRFTRGRMLRFAQVPGGECCLLLTFPKTVGPSFNPIGTQLGSDSVTRRRSSQPLAFRASSRELRRPCEVSFPLWFGTRTVPLQGPNRDTRTREARISAPALVHSRGRFPLRRRVSDRARGNPIPRARISDHPLHPRASGGAGAKGMRREITSSIP